MDFGGQDSTQNSNQWNQQSFKLSAAQDNITESLNSAPKHPTEKVTATSLVHTWDTRILFPAWCSGCPTRQSGTSLVWQSGPWKAQLVKFAADAGEMGTGSRHGRPVRGFSALERMGWRNSALHSRGNTQSWTSKAAPRNSLSPASGIH